MSNLDDDSQQIEDPQQREGNGLQKRIRRLLEGGVRILGKRALSVTEITQLQHAVRGNQIIRNIFDDSGDEEAEDTEPMEVPRFLEEEQAEERSSATARTKLYKSEWSPNFVHSSDMLVPVCQLAEHILRPGERLTQMNSMRWHKIVTCDMQLAMSEREMPQDDVAVSGSFLTSNDRVLHFSGRQLPEHPVQTKEARNGIAANMLCEASPSDVKPGTYNLPLHMPPDIMIKLLNDSPPIMVATLVELLNYGIVLFRNDKYPDRDANLSLLAEVRNLPIPENMQELMSFSHGILHLEPRVGEVRQGRSGMKLIPISFRFPQQIETGEILLAHTTDRAVIRSHLAAIPLGNS